MKPDEKERLIGNIVAHMGPAKKEIQVRAIENFRKADPAYGDGIAKGLGLLKPAHV